MTIRRDTTSITNILDRPVGRFVYSSSVPTSAVNIAYIDTGNIRPECIMLVKDDLNPFLSYEVLSGRYEMGLVDASKTLKVRSNSVEITDKYNKYKTPLFFKHILKTTPWVDQQDSISLSIVNGNLEPVNAGLFYFDANTNTIYHNFENFVTEEKYAIFYVKYIAAGSSNQIIDSGHIEVLEAAPAYEQAIETMFTCINRLSYTSSGFLIETNLGSDSVMYPYVITVPSEGTWAYRYTGNNVIKLTRSSQDSLTRPWYLNIISTSTEFGGIAYSVPESTTFSYYPYFPYSFNNMEEATYVYERAIKVKKPKILLSDNYHVEVLIKNASGEEIAAYTTNPLQVGLFSTNVVWEFLFFENIDREGGFIHIPMSISPSQTFLVSYFGEETSVPLVFKNFNPHFDKSLFLQKTYVYIKPADDVTDRSVYFCVFDKNGTVFYNNSSWSYTSNDPSLHVDSDLNKELIITTEVEFLQLMYPYSTQMLLGYVSFVTYPSHKDATVIDCRTPGGGLAENAPISVNNLLYYPEAHWMWDDGHFGMLYPGQGALVVHLPDTLLDTFTEEEIREKTLKHMAMGVYPIIKFYSECGGGFGTYGFGSCPFG